MKKETWKYILQLIIAILTAILTTFGVTSCMGYPLFWAGVNESTSQQVYESTSLRVYEAKGTKPSKLLKPPKPRRSRTKPPTKPEINLGEAELNQFINQLNKIGLSTGRKGLKV